LDASEAISHRGEFRRVILRDHTVVWGRISMSDNDKIYVVSSRNNILEIPLKQVVQII
jgi:hypothetical protein